MKSLTIVLLAIALGVAGCKTTQKGPVVITEKLVPVSVPDKLFNCPEVRRLPEVETLSDREVAQLIVHLYSNNLTCKNSERAIKDYLRGISSRR